jgi:Family of unknown function (DUF6941)
MPSPPIPTVLAMLLCDLVITDAESKKKTLVGVFERMYTPETPFIYPRGFSIYARLSDAEGHYTFKVETLYLEDDKIVQTSSIHEFNAPERLGVVEIVMVLPVMGFEKLGTYEFQLYANEVYIGRTTLKVMTPPQKGN